MTSFLGTFRIGESFAVALTAKSGDPTQFTATAWLHRSTDKINFVPDPKFTPLQLTVSSRVANSTLGAGWNISVSVSQSRTLKPGFYGIDAAIQPTNGETNITDNTAMIEMTKSAIPIV